MPFDPPNDQMLPSRGFSCEDLPGSPTTSFETARAWLTEGAGWVETHRELMPWTAGDPLPEGHILHAELAIGADVSIEVRWDGARWIGTRFTEIGSADNVVTTSSFVSTASHGREKMLYRTWWSAVERDGVGVLEPQAARFAGWAGE